MGTVWCKKVSHEKAGIADGHDNSRNIMNRYCSFEFYNGIGVWKLDAQAGSNQRQAQQGIDHMPDPDPYGIEVNSFGLVIHGLDRFFNAQNGMDNDSHDSQAKNNNTDDVQGIAFVGADGGGISH